MPLKRPSSARRNINQETFSAAVSCARLRNIQSVLNSGTVSSAKSPDAILCIFGIDSRYNDGTDELVNYLLFGFFDLRKDEIESCGYPQETIDDLVFLIKKDSVHVYCNPVNYLYLLPYIAHWRNLRIHCMTETEYDDEEAAEEFKIYSFIEMVKDCSTIGIPYSARGHPHPFDPFTVEKWPVVQAFALEGFGGGGFFTMKHEVVDVSEAVHHMYSVIDPVNLEVLVTEHVPLFERQWKSMLTNVDIEHPSGLGKLVESTILEPLKSYYNHGHVSPMEGEMNIKQPFVLFGTQSNKSRLETARKNSIAHDTVVSEAGIDGRYPTHMVCQAVSPRGPVTCSRTYFFSSGHIPYPVSGGAGDLMREKTDLSILNRMYVEAINAVMTAIQTYSKTLSAQKAEKLLIETFKKGCETHKLPINSAFFTSREHVEFNIEAVDMHGQQILLKEGQSLPFIKVAQLSVYDIPSYEYSGKTLGSIVFSETFQESRLKVMHPDESLTMDSQFLILTDHIPRYVSWAASENDIQLSQEVQAFIKNSGESNYGKVLVNGESALMVGNKQLCVPDEGKIFVYENGLVFLHSRFGPIVLPKSHMEKIQLYDGDSPSVVALIIITYKGSFWQWLPMQCQDREHTMIFSLTPRTKGYRAFYSEVLSLWKTSSEEPKLVMLEELPEKHCELHNQLQTEYMVTNVSSTKRITPLMKAKAVLGNLTNFLDHMTVTSLGNKSVPYVELPAILNQPFDSGNFADEIIITIVSGIPGSHKENLCNTLTNLAKEQSRWVTLKQPLDYVDEFTAESLQSSLSTIVAANRKRGVRASSSSRMKQRVLVMTPGFTDVLEVVQAIACHPDSDVGRLLKIGAVTACVDPLNCFMTHRYTFPKLLENCSEGWVNNILLTSSTEPKNTDLNAIQQLLRSVNSNMAFMLANHGEVTRSQDIDLILSESAFTEGRMIRQRYLSCPEWSLDEFHSGTMLPQMMEVCLRFNPPLERYRLQNKLRSLRNSLVKHPFNGNIYSVRGRVRFTDSGIKATEFRFATQSGYMLMTLAEVQPTPPPPPPTQSASNGPVTPAEQGGMNFVVFTGVGLEESQLKDWLKACAKQKPQRKEHRTKETLTKQEMKNIHTKHHLDPLPEGWFYNGLQFVSMGGDKSSSHPDMDKFIGDYLNSVNQQVDSYNQRIDQQTFVDLFDE
ncbi:dynein axonemal assembly factor 9-like [Glandiceps talaboti]